MDGSEAASASVVTQSVLTFVGVFLVCCAVLLALFAWRRITDPSYRWDYRFSDCLCWCLLV